MWAYCKTKDRIIKLDDIVSIEIQKPEGRTLFEIVALDKRFNAYVLGEYKSKDEARMVLNSIAEQIANELLRL